MEISLPRLNNDESLISRIFGKAELMFGSIVKNETMPASLYEPSIKARIIEIKQETHDTKTYTLKLESTLNRYKAGQHIAIEINLGDAVVSRIYTLSSVSYCQSKVAITVKKQHDGAMSSWLFESSKLGDEVKISEANGEFHLPEQTPGKLLFIAAGSGITPIMAMLRYLSTTGNKSEITLLYYVRSTQDVIFFEDLKELTSERSNISLVVIPEVESETLQGISGRITLRQFRSLIPAPSEQIIYLCGPQTFMKKVREVLQKCDVPESSIHSENFGATYGRDELAVSIGEHTLSFKESAKEIDGSQSNTILQHAESIGLKPKSACRTGICRTCRCKKVSGKTLNLATGEVSSRENDYILPCVTVAQSDVELAL